MDTCFAHTMLANHTESAPAFTTPSPVSAAVMACRLSPQGAACIDRWVVANASQLAAQSLPAWHLYAESVANSTPAGEAIVIEMAMSMTKSGYPEALRCAPGWFVAV
jgi:hypothetical protein